MDKNSVNVYLATHKRVMPCPICAQRPGVITIDRDEFGGQLFVIECRQCGILARTNRIAGGTENDKILMMCKRAWNHQAQVFRWLLKNSGLEEEDATMMRQIVLKKLRSHF